MCIAELSIVYAYPQGVTYMCAPEAPCVARRGQQAPKCSWHAKLTCVVAQGHQSAETPNANGEDNTEDYTRRSAAVALTSELMPGGQPREVISVSGGVRPCSIREC